MLVTQDKSFAEFLATMGERNNMADVNMNLSAKKPNSAIEALNALVEARERMKTMDMAKEYLDGPQKKDPNDNLAASIVKGAMDTTKDVMATLQKEKSEAQAAASQAYAESDNLKAQLYSNQIKQIQDMQDKLLKSLEETKRTNQPDGLVGQLESVIKVMEIMEQRFRQPQNMEQVQARVAPEMSESTQLRLLEMKQNHELAMKKLDLELMQHKQEWDLQMQQFREESNRRWKEYTDGQKFKQSSLSGFQDLFGSLSEAITSERTGQAATIEGQAVEEGTAQEEPQVQAAIKSFPCQFCETMVGVSPEAETVKCPKCQSEYQISRQ